MTRVSPLVLSLQVSIFATLVAGVAGIGLAAVLARGRFPGRDLLELVATAPMVLPPTVLGYFLLVVLGRRSTLGQLWEGLTGEPLVFTRAGAVVAASVACLPLVVRSARAALEDVDESLMWAARTLGAGPVRRFFTVELPVAARGVGAGLALGFARAMGDFGVTLMVAGNIPGETRTAALAIYDALQAGHDTEATGLALALTAVALSMLLLVGRLARRVAS
jgi:molybdate transport system permease protein